MAEIKLVAAPALPGYPGILIEGFACDEGAFACILMDGGGLSGEVRLDGHFDAAELRALADKVDELRSKSLNEVRYG